MAQLESIPEIISLARRSGLESVADRLDYLYNLDVDNGDSQMNFDTTKMLVSFMIEHPEMTTDMITVSADGFTHAIWNITSNSELYAQFLPSGNVLYIHAMDNKDSEGFKILKRGECSPSDMFKSIMPLIERLS